MELTSLKSTGQASRLETSEEMTVQLESEGAWKQNSFFLRELQPFLFSPRLIGRGPPHNGGSSA